MPIRPAPSVLRAVDVLALLAREPEQRWSLSGVARELSMNKATCQSVLLALVERGCATRSPSGGYSLGPALVSLGIAARASLEVVSAAEPVAKELSSELGVTCLVALLAGQDMVIAVAVNSSSPFGSGATVGNAVPHVPPLGAVLVAWSDDDDVERWLDRAAPPLTAKERARYLRVLGAIRRNGFSVVSHQLEHGDEITADLLVEPASRAARGRRDRALAGLGHAEALILLTGFPREIDAHEVQAVGEQLNAAARRLTVSVGGTWPSSPVAARRR